MTPAVLRLFTEDEPDEVVLPECSALDPPCLSEALAQCASSRCAPAMKACSFASACLRSSVMVPLWGGCYMMAEPWTSAFW